MKKIYIAGPIKGIENNNHKAFDEAERILRKNNFIPSNPVDIARVCKEENRQFYLKASLRLMLMCDSIFLLDGWEKSEGANNEIHNGLLLGYKFYILENGSIIEKQIKLDSRFINEKI